MSESAPAVNLEHFDGHYETEKQDWNWLKLYV